MNHPQCKLCNLGVGYVDISPTEASRKYGVARSSVRRHNTHAALFGVVAPPASIAQPSEEVSKTPNGIVISRTDSEWEVAKADGEIVVLHSSKVTTAPDLTNDAIIKRIVAEGKDSIKSFKMPVKPHKSTNKKGKVLALADAQIGKGNQRGGNSQSTLDLLNLAAASFIEEIKEENISQATIVDVGDIIEGFFNFNGQREQNDLDLVSQLDLAFTFLLHTITSTAPYVDNLYFVSVPSNHCEVRAGKKDQIGSSDNDYGILLSKMLETVILSNDQFSNVTFIRPENSYLQAEWSFAGTRLAVFHGHNVGNINSHAKWWKDQAFNRRPGWNADILITGHYHIQRLEEVDKGRWIIHCPTAESGSDKFENISGSSGQRGVAIFDVLDGKWSNYHTINLLKL